jgi:hypothetical protein
MTFRVILPFCNSLTRNEEMHDTHRLYAPFANAIVSLSLPSLTMSPSRDNNYTNLSRTT